MTLAALQHGIDGAADHRVLLATAAFRRSAVTVVALRAQAMSSRMLARLTRLLFGLASEIMNARVGNAVSSVVPEASILAPGQLRRHSILGWLMARLPARRPIPESGGYPSRVDGASVRSDWIMQKASDILQACREAVSAVAFRAGTCVAALAFVTRSTPLGALGRNGPVDDAGSGTKYVGRGSNVPVLGGTFCGGTLGPSGRLRYRTAEKAFGVGIIPSRLSAI